MKFNWDYVTNSNGSYKWLLTGALAILALALGSKAADYPVIPKFQRQPAIRETLARVDATQDRWVGEQDYEALQKKVKEIILGDTELTSRFKELTVAEAKIISSDRATADSTSASFRVRVELGGTAKSGEFLSLLGQWDASFSRSGETWKLAELIQRPLRELSAPRRWFADITEKTIGHNGAYQNQLKYGIDHFRERLDVATGIDVYGHQGIAVVDYDGDGLEDFYVLQPSGLPNRLFHNDGNGAFSERSQAAGLDILDDSRAALFADIDNDGDQDLILITSSRPLLFLNKGGVFTLAPKAFPNAPGNFTSAVIADYDRDGFLDIYLCSYDFWSPGKRYNSPTPYYDATNGPPNFLFRNRGNGTFEDATARSGLNVNNNRYSFAAAWGDFNNDNWPDLFVANDFGRKNLYRNNGDGTFTDVAVAMDAEDAGAGMSAAWGDFNNDGRLDLYAGNMWSSAGLRLTGNAQFQIPDERARRLLQRQARGNTLLANGAAGKFEDVTADAGVGMGRWSWASGFADFDNDGFLDLFIQNGYITGADTHDL